MKLLLKSNFFYSYIQYSNIY